MSDASQGSVTAKPVLQEHDRFFNANQSGGSNTTFMINNSHVNFIMIDRENVPTPCPAKSANYISEDYITIGKQYSWSTQMAIETAFKILQQRVTVESRNPTNETMFLVYSAFVEALKANHTTSSLSCVVSRRYPVGLFKNPYVRRYIPDYDILVDTVFNSELSYHPESPMGKMMLKGNRAQLNESEPPLTSLRVELDIVDNDSHYGTKYIYFGNEVLSVQPIKDINRPNGVYISKRMSVNGVMTQQADTLSMEEAKIALNLSDTRDQVLGADSSAQKIREQADLELAQLRLSTAQAQGLAHKNEQALKTRISELERQTAEDTARLSAAKADQTAATIKLQSEHEALLASLKIQVEAARAAASASTQATTITKNEIDTHASRYDAHAAEVEAARKHYFATLKDRTDITHTILKHAAPVLAGAASVIILNSLMKPKSSSVTNLDGW